MIAQGEHWSIGTTYRKRALRVLRVDGEHRLMHRTCARRPLRTRGGTRSWGGRQWRARSAAYLVPVRAWSERVGVWSRRVGVWGSARVGARGEGNGEG